jgi:hypothetical protein
MECRRDMQRARPTEKDWLRWISKVGDTVNKSDLVKDRAYGR